MILVSSGVDVLCVLYKTSVFSKIDIIRCAILQRSSVQTRNAIVEIDLFISSNIFFSEYKNYRIAKVL